MQAHDGVRDEGDKQKKEGHAQQQQQQQPQGKGEKPSKCKEETHRTARRKESKRESHHGVLKCRLLQICEFVHRLEHSKRFFPGYHNPVINSDAGKKPCGVGNRARDQGPKSAGNGAEERKWAKNKPCSKVVCPKLSRLEFDNDKRLISHAVFVHRLEVCQHVAEHKRQLQYKKKAGGRERRKGMKGQGCTFTTNQRKHRERERGRDQQALPPPFLISFKHTHTHTHFVELPPVVGVLALHLFLCRKPSTTKEIKEKRGGHSQFVKKQKGE